MYLAPACFFWLMLGVAVVEWPAMRENNALQLIADKPITYLAAAAMGFCVNLLAYMVIQTASSLTLKVRLKPPGSADGLFNIHLNYVNLLAYGMI